MNKENVEKLMECHILLSEAIAGYEDRALISNKLFDVRQYRNKLPEDAYKKIESFMNENIRPVAYDSDYWRFIETDERYGALDENNHFIVNSDSSLESIIFSKYHHSLALLDKLNTFMSAEFQLSYK